jgi:hypothetical protein
MHHPLHVDPHVRILETLDPSSAPVTVREEREGVARNLLEDRVVVMTGEGHRVQDMAITAVTARAHFES